MIYIYIYIFESFVDILYHFHLVLFYLVLYIYEINISRFAYFLTMLYTQFNVTMVTSSKSRTPRKNFTIRTIFSALHLLTFLFPPTSCSRTRAALLCKCTRWNGLDLAMIARRQPPHSYGSSLHLVRGDGRGGNGLCAIHAQLI